MTIELWFSLLILICTVTYVGLITAFYYGFNKIKTLPEPLIPRQTKVSVILPFYNESANLVPCIRSVVQQQTRNIDWELLAIDDFSTDGSAEVVKQMLVFTQRIVLINNTIKGKKQALLAGIEKAKGQLIITIDADCYYPPKWLQTMTENFLQTNAKLLIGPVVISPVKTWFQQFQFTDLLSLVGSGAGAAGLGHPIMCNGANLAFDKNAFETLHDPLKLKFLSGDDVFLLHAMKAKYPNEIHFVKNINALVKTKPTLTFGQFMNQRIRWSGKASGYSDPDTLLTTAIVASTILIMGLAIIGSFILPELLVPLITMFTIKMLIDGVFLYKLTSLFGQKRSLLWLPIFELIFIGYVSLLFILYPFTQIKKTW